MSFPTKIPYGLKELKALVSGDVSSIISDIKDWCNKRFSLLGHSHSEYANKSHSHVISDVTKLQSTLNGKTSTNHTHSGYAPSSHVSDTTKHITATERNTWNEKADEDHTHPQSDITGLVSDLANKSDKGHTHNI